MPGEFHHGGAMVKGSASSGPGGSSGTRPAARSVSRCRPSSMAPTSIDAPSTARHGACGDSRYSMRRSRGSESVGVPSVMRSWRSVQGTGAVGGPLNWWVPNSSRSTRNTAGAPGGGGRRRTRVAPPLVPIQASPAASIRKLSSLTSFHTRPLSRSSSPSHSPCGPRRKTPRPVPSQISFPGPWTTHIGSAPPKDALGIRRRSCARSPDKV